MNVANGFYARKQYELAAPEYDRYLATYLEGPDRETALFRLGECYKKMGDTNGAKNAYTMLLGDFSEGDFIGPAAYRLADILYHEKDYDDALPVTTGRRPRRRKTSRCRTRRNSTRRGASRNCTTTTRRATCT